MWEGYKFVEYRVDMYNGTISLRAQTKIQFFPLQSTHACFSLGSKLTLVVDGQLLGEADYRREEDKDRPANLSLLLGRRPKDGQEYSGRTTDLNVFITFIGLWTVGRMSFVIWFPSSGVYD